MVSMLEDNLQSRELLDLLDEVEKFSVNEFLPAVTLGNSVLKAKDLKLLEKSRYSGLSERDFIDNNLDVDNIFGKIII